MKKVIQDAINEQIREEFNSAYLYLAMSAYFERKNLAGFAYWLKVQWEEETEHAMKLYNFLLQRGGTVELKKLDEPPVDFGTPLEAFKQVLKHEQYITSCIHKLYDLAVEEKDYAFRTLLHWFIDEQVEEEDNAGSILDKLELIGDSGAALYHLDQEMGNRPPEEEGE